MSKGDDTRRLILDQAMSLASRTGLEALSIGGLSDEVGMSKSGLFAHFGSKQKLQLAVVQTAAQEFADLVIRPAFAAPRGEPRIRELVQNWIAWGQSSRRPGGCLFVQLTAELDDQPGPVRDLLVSLQRDWMDLLAESARRAVVEGHFSPALDPQLFAFSLYSHMLGFHHSNRLLADPRAMEYLTSCLDALFAASRVPPGPAPAE